jgi:hypothetical protein
VLPDGKVISLTGDAMRARVTKSLREEHFAPIGEAIEYSFHTFGNGRISLTPPARLK